MKQEDLSINAPCSFECTGCSVCKVVCPVEGCIDISLDSDGYLFAESNPETCINCNRCQEVCFKFQDKFDLEFSNPLDVYIGTNVDQEIHYHSSSGGITTALLESAIDLGYIVIGAEFDTNTNRVHHVFIEKKEDLHRIRGSKYLPSITFDAFEKIDKNKKYVVVGTPCQIGGLAKMKKQNKGFDDLLLIDFRCFGHPGYNLFDKYLDFLQTEVNNSGIRHINMRSKEINWHRWGVSLEFNDGEKYYNSKFKDPFGAAFITGQSVHDVCLNCDEYKNNTHADIRVEDAWAFVGGQTGDKLKNGLSQIGIFSKKGSELFRYAQKKMEIQKVDFDYSLGEWMKVQREKTFMNDLQDKELSLKEVLERFWEANPYKKRTHVWQWLNTHKIYTEYLRHLPKPLKEKFIDIAVYLFMDLKKS
jgi:coenzyme F420-reducing hydrogenase beta subunit